MTEVAASSAAQAALSFRLTRGALRLLGLCALIMAAIAVLSFTVPYFFTANNIVNLLRQASATEIATVGGTLVVVAGEIDLSVGAVLVLAAVAVAWTSEQGIPIAGMLFAALAVGVLIGTLNGWLVVKCKVPSFLATLGTLSIASGLSYTISLGPTPVRNRLFAHFFEATPGGLPVPVLVAIVCVLLGAGIYNRTSFGVWTRAVGSSAVGARLGGLNAGRQKFLVLMIGSTFAAVGGLVWAGQTGMGMANSEGGLELVVLSAVILGGGRLGGGVGSVIGSALGALFLTVVFVGISMAGLPGPYQDIARGFAVGIAVVLMRM